MAGINKTINITLNGPINFTISCSDSVPVPSAPVPLVSADFKNGVYSINGASKTVGEVWEENLAWSQYNAANVVAGVGLREYGSAAAENFSRPVLTSEAFAAVGQEYVVVVDYVFSGLPLSGGYLSCGVILIDLPSYASAASAFVGALNTGVYDYASLFETTTSPTTNGNHKVSARVSGDSIYMSSDGSAAVGGVTQDLSATNHIAIDAYTADGDVTAFWAIEKIEFFALSDYAADDLPTLSVQ